MKKWILRAKFNRSLIHEGHSKSWSGRKTGQFLYFGKGSWGTKRDATLFKTESAAKSKKTISQNKVDEGWHLPIEHLEIVEANISIG